MDFWASRIHASKNFSASSAVNSGHLSSVLADDNHLVLDDLEENDDGRTYFTCPFCYVDIELSLLCSHLQDDHCFSVKNAVCPVCALNLGKDVIGHFMIHHASSLKGRRKSQKSGFWSNSTLRDLTSCYDLTSRNNTNNVPESAADPLLTPFLCPISFSEPNTDLQEDTCSSNDASVEVEPESSKASIGKDNDQDEDSKERMKRVSFVQQLFLSTFIE